jgi:hypothetical protein
MVYWRMAQLEARVTDLLRYFAGAFVMSALIASVMGKQDLALFNAVLSIAVSLIYRNFKES